MILYHGSNLAIPKPDILHSRPYVDFGRGFYATPLKEQAEQWCKRYKRQGKEAVLSIYAMDERKMAERKLLSFDTYSLDWLDFVVKCRSGQDKSDYDIVIGGIANDKVFNTVELYFDHLIDEEEAIKRLRYEKPNIQYCFRTEEALSVLHYEGSEIL